MAHPAACATSHDMVRGTGLGADSGVVIEAKMIDALLSDRPDDRRELFEEAAGVGLYRDRRRTTARRLEETTVDLSRLDDLIYEVQSQVRSLARQRKKAERHGELMARRFVAEITLVVARDGVVARRSSERSSSRWQRCVRRCRPRSSACTRWSVSARRRTGRARLQRPDARSSRVS